MPDPAPSRSSGPAREPDAAPMDQGILIEMNDNNDICINATHLTVKCDNSFLMQGTNTSGAKVSGKAKGSAVAGKSSVIVVQQPEQKAAQRFELPDARTCAKNTAVAGAILVASRLAGRVVSWHWVRNRTERALATRSASRLSHLITHANPRTRRAAMTHIALDIQHASNLRLATPAEAVFPSLSDVELSRMSAAHARKQAAAQDAVTAQNAASTGASALSHESMRPASALSVVSAETTQTSSEGGDSSSTCTPERPQSPVNGIVTTPLEPTSPAPSDVGPAAVGGKQPTLPCPAAVLPSSEAADGEDASPSIAMSTLPQQQQLQVVRRRGPWPDGAPPEGRAACMLAQDAELWGTFIATVRLMLCSADLGQQHDASFAVQVVAFSNERLAQKLIESGVVGMLLACVPTGFGSRVRAGGARLRQPGTPQTRGLPSANSLLAISPIYLPSVHMDIKHRSVTLTPRGVNYAFLSLIPSLGRRLQRQLVPRCRATAAKTSVALEALQNVAALRTGAKELLAIEGSLDVICSAAYTAPTLGRLAAIEIAHSCILNFPRTRTRLYHVGFDQALANAVDNSRSTVVREACMRTWMRLQPDRELLSSDMGRGSMYS